MRASPHREGNFPSGRSCPSGRRSSHPGGAVPTGRRSCPTGTELPEGDVPSGRRSSVREKEVSHWDGVALRKEMFPPGGAVPTGTRSCPTGTELPSARRCSDREKELSHRDGAPSGRRRSLREEKSRPGEGGVPPGRSCPLGGDVPAARRSSDREKEGSHRAA